MKGFIKILLLLCALSLAKAKPVPETSDNLGEIWNVQDWGTVSEFETSLDEEEDEKAWDEDWDEEEDEEDWSEEEDEEAWDESDENPQWIEDSDLEGWNEPEWENDRSQEEKNDEGEEEGDEVETVDADPAIDDANDESEGYEGSSWIFIEGGGGGGARNRVDTLVFDVIILCMSAVFPRTFNGFDFNPSILKKLF